MPIMSASISPKKTMSGFRSPAHFGQDGGFPGAVFYQQGNGAFGVSQVKSIELFHRKGLLSQRVPARPRIRTRVPLLRAGRMVLSEGAGILSKREAVSKLYSTSSTLCLCR